MRGYNVIAIAAVMAVCGCCSKRHATQAMEVRRADSVTELAARRVTSLDRETVTETLVMRPDSTGTLRVVARDVVRTTDRSTARATDTVVSSVTASSERRQASEDVSTVEPARVRVPWVWVAMPWALLSGLVTLLALYLARKGKTWTSRH